MKFIATAIEEVILIEPVIYKDDRGFFLERYRKNEFLEHGIAYDFVQVNQSFSHKNVLRGLHYQLNSAQAKVIMVVSGSIYDVAVDIRAGSPTFGKSVEVNLAADTGRMLFIPEGFAHGFLALADDTVVIYSCSDYYSPKDERGIAWNDPDINIPWPMSSDIQPILSNSDAGYGCLKDTTPENLPKYREKG